jgi:hypothetical protein
MQDGCPLIEQAASPTGPGDSDAEQSPYENPSRLLGAFTEMHELAHSLRIGEADDQDKPLPCGEIYSGNSGIQEGFVKDDTPEEVQIGQIERQRWSIMRSGWGQQTLIQNDGATRFAFSFEELLSIEHPEK